HLTLSLGLLVCSMALERTGQRKLAQLVTDHVLGHIYRHMLLTVVHGDRQTDEVGQDCRAAGPGLDRLLVLVGLRGFDFFQQMGVTERPFFQRTCHVLPLISCRGARRSWKKCAY